MRDVLVFASLACASIVGCGNASVRGEPSGIRTTRSAIIGGTLDSGDPSVIELLYIVALSPSECATGSRCAQSCLDLTSGQPCSSGATCLCGVGATCTGELVGPRSLLTAGHCTDLTAGGTISGSGGPALKLCTSEADVLALASGMLPSSGCNTDAFALFNNKCTTTDSMESCEKTLIQYGDYVFADQVINPGYDANVQAPFPDSAANTDNDIGLVHLSSATLHNGESEPDLLVFNRADLGAQCNDLGDLRAVGYGITDPSLGTSAHSGLKYTVSHDTKVRDLWHLEADGAQADPLQVCGAGSGLEPTCEGDSGGPTFDSTGHIVAVTSYGDPACVDIAVSTRTDAYATWIDSTMEGWGDPKNGTVLPRDGGTTTCDACAWDDSGPGGGHPAPSPEASIPGDGADASSPDEASAQNDASAPPAAAQASSSGGCSVGTTGRNSGPAPALVPLLMMATTFLRRSRAVRRDAREPAP